MRLGVKLFICWFGSRSMAEHRLGWYESDGS